MKTIDRAVVGLSLFAATLLFPAVVSSDTNSYQQSGVSAHAYGNGYDPATNTSRYFEVSASENSWHEPGAGQNVSIYGYVYGAQYHYDAVTNILEVYYGSGYVTDVHLQKSLGSGSVSGSVTVYHYIFDYNDYSSTYLGSYEVSVDATLEGDGPVSKTKSTSTYKDPSHYNSHYTSSGSSRSATVTVLIDGEDFLLNSYSVGGLSDGKTSFKYTINP